MNRYFSKRELAERLSVTVRTIDAWVQAGRLPAPVKLGDKPQSRVRWDADELGDLDTRLRGFGRQP